MTQQYYTLGDVARLTRTTPHRIHYWIMSGQVPEPSLRIGSRRIWTVEEIVAVSERSQLDKAQEMEDDGRR